MSINGRNNKSNITAIIAEIIVIKANWLIDLNSENNNGRSEIIITIVVLHTALNVYLLQYSKASFMVLFSFRFILYAEIICIESSTINPNTIARINAFDKLK